jgi:hypothetical protein
MVQYFGTFLKLKHLKAVPFSFLCSISNAAAITMKLVVHVKELRRSTINNCKAKCEKVELNDWWKQFLTSS